MSKSKARKAKARPERLSRRLDDAVRGVTEKMSLVSRTRVVAAGFTAARAAADGLVVALEDTTGYKELRQAHREQSSAMWKTWAAAFMSSNGLSGPRMVRDVEHLVDDQARGWADARFTLGTPVSSAQAVLTGARAAEREKLTLVKGENEEPFVTVTLSS